ncbi:MAG: hypothetical protein HUU32_09760 [Calditrichaceae bacterium]|nr:hypothetical protein [Calditrichia bacterium]NUQ41665.1 hypothetical protein [Calditrichaceae bacterium]
MYEITTVRQDDPALRFRWFASENCDSELYIWEQRDSRAIVRFQFYFDRKWEEKVVEWKSSNSLWYAGIDDENRFYNASPVLRRLESIDLQEVLDIFMSIAEDVDEYIKEFVAEILKMKLCQA